MFEFINKINMCGGWQERKIQKLSHFISLVQNRPAKCQSLGLKIITAWIITRQVVVVNIWRIIEDGPTAMWNGIQPEKQKISHFMSLILQNHPGKCQSRLGIIIVKYYDLLSRKINIIHEDRATYMWWWHSAGEKYKKYHISSHWYYKTLLQNANRFA